MAGGRHSSPDSGRSIGFYAVGGLVAVAVVATGVVVFKATQSDSCESVDEYSLAADPAIAPAVTEILAESSPEQTGCSRITVTSALPGDVAEPWVRAWTRRTCGYRIRQRGWAKLH